MFKSEWMRLWIFLTAMLLFGVTVVSAFYIWGSDVCYRFVTFTIADDVQLHDRQIAEAVERECFSKTFCGDVQTSVLLNLETLSKRGLVKQVGLQWYEPKGWSYDELNMIDKLNNGEITASRIFSEVSGFVYKARLRRAVFFVVASLAMSLIVLAIGHGIAWVRNMSAK